MEHLVIRHNPNKTVIISYLHGVPRTTSENEFRNQIASVCDSIFSISTVSDSLYFVGFESDSPEGIFARQIHDRLFESDNPVQAIKDGLTEKEATILFKMFPKASFLVRLEAQVPLHKGLTPITHACKVNHEHNSNKITQNAFGEYLCEDCWTDYIHSEDRGLVEYAISIGKGISSISVLSKTEIAAVQEMWIQKRADIVILTEDEKVAVESKWEELGYPLVSNSNVQPQPTE